MTVDDATGQVETWLAAPAAYGRRHRVDLGTTGQVETWLAAPAAVVAQPTARHSGLLRGLLRETGTSGNLTTDAHLAALAVEHGAETVSYDRDLARFPGVHHRLPADPRIQAAPSRLGSDVGARGPVSSEDAASRAGATSRERPGPCAICARELPICKLG